MATNQEMCIPRTSSRGGLLLAFTGGMVAGAAAALLTAPRAGKDTRRLIGQTAQRQKEAVSRIPKALREAYVAGSEAAASAYTESLEHQSNGKQHHQKALSS